MEFFYKLSLNEYYSYTQKSFYFFDGMIKLSDKSQKKLFEERKIVQSTYRANRSKKNGSVKIVNELLEFFSCNKLNEINQLKIEELLNRIFYCVFYKKNDEFKALLFELEKYIALNTIINPILKLYRFLIWANSDYDKSELVNISKDDVEYLSAFLGTKFFEKELEYLYKSLLFMMGKYNDVDYLEKNAFKYDSVTWLYFNARAAKAYYSGSHEEALKYYERVLKIYQSSYNFKRVVMVINIIAAERNNTGDYRYSLEECLKVLDYAYSLADQRQAINLSLHYVYAKYQLNEYKDIIEFYYQYFKRLNDYNYVAVVVIMLTAYKLKRNDVIDELFNNYNNEYLLAFYRYINDNDDSLISKLKHSSYSQKLYMELKSIINTKK